MNLTRFLEYVPRGVGRSRMHTVAMSTLTYSHTIEQTKPLIRFAALVNLINLNHFQHTNQIKRKKYFFNKLNDRPQI